MNQFLRFCCLVDVSVLVSEGPLLYFGTMDQVQYKDQQAIHTLQAQQKRLLSPSMSASNAECVDYCDVQAGVSMAIWKNQADHIFNENLGIHTLSMYLEGGENAYRVDLRDRLGGPGKMCFMPAGHHSEWYVTEPLRLLHLYFTDEHLNYLGLTAFDLDPRVLQLHDLTYETGGSLALGLKRLLQHMKGADLVDKLALQECQQELLLYLLEHHSQRKTESVRGGLSPHAKNRVLDYIETHLGEALSLQQLAGTAHLSTYHFARMFQQSVGLSPYQYLLKRRLHHAQQLMQQKQSLAATMQACGFDNHSRFARAFRRAYGITPSHYQAAL